jgi:hypothetical protein
LLIYQKAGSRQKVDRLLLHASFVLQPLALIIGGVAYNFSVLLIILGVLVAFSAVYDRCPIYRAVSGGSNQVFKKSRRQ